MEHFCVPTLCRADGVNPYLATHLVPCLVSKRSRDCSDGPTTDEI